MNIRNFSIIAHIDHGKSTLADRILEVTQTVSKRELTTQILDDMELERERGITIKARACRLKYIDPRTNTEWQFNLIDTPGHVDFNYEVSRSLAACEAAILVVDASQGIEAQTLANVYLAMDNNLTIIPVLNKIDLPSAEPDRVAKEIEDVLGLPKDEVLHCSAKTGIGIEAILQAIIDRAPAPPNLPDEPLKALIFDSWYDSYQGVVALVRVKEGQIKFGDKIRFMNTNADYEVLRLGVLAPNFKETKEILCGEVGCVIGGVRNIKHIQIGDTVTFSNRPAEEALKGFKPSKPMVFSGFYPIDSEDYENLKDALEKLQLNDSSLVYEPENSIALGFGFRVGFLGLLHMEIIQERLEREFDLVLISTAPSVTYKVETTKGELLDVDNPSKLPETSKIQKIEEPFIKASIHTPNEFVGAIITLCEQKRGVQINLDYVTETRVCILYELPLNEIVFDFYDKLKSISRGYASLDYELSNYQESDLVKIDILVNGTAVDALSIICHRSVAALRGRQLASRLKEFIPRQMYEVPIQAAIGTKVVARETIKALRKDVLAKCYGGDVSRKRKLLEKQKEGKKRMKSVGNVEIPQEAFLAVLKVGDEG